MPLESVVYPRDPFGYISSCNEFMFHDLYYQEDVLQDTKSNIDNLGQEHSYVENEKLISNLRETEEVDDGQCRDYYQQPIIPSLEKELIRPAIDIENNPSLQMRKRRRRTRSNKNKEEIENQRMTHIAVERNRRKQMNEYLAVLRSLMPSSYAQRGDQASIVGGAINYVKELEHILQSMEPKRIKTTTHNAEGSNNSTNSLVDPYSDFFTLPDYSRTKSSITESSSSPPEIEVTLVESHANIKIIAKKKPKQLLNIIASIQSLRLTLLHLSVTTHDDSILYSINVKVEDGSNLNTVDDIAAALNQIIRRISEES